VHDSRELWVCADPNNLPFSNERQQGFENKIAAVVARDMGKTLRYFWEPQRRGFVRTTLNAGNCDLIIGVPASYERVETTRPYYRSTYVFVSRHDRHLQLRSFDDPRLPKLLIAIQLTGEDYENPPAAQALAMRRLANNVRGFPVYGDYSQAAPHRAVVDAVANKTVDTAVVWGPVGGYFALRSSVPLDVTPVDATSTAPVLQFAFDISMGVRRGDRQAVDDLNRMLERRQVETRTILARYGVPTLPVGAP
jgi:quinoprotein dehydrogenase-associated probable ABC transporter substrate-binding protein